jgi:uncharacterized membrane protein
MGRRANIPWIGVEYTMDKGFNILYVLTLPMVYRTPYTWYFDPFTHGIVTPLPMVF